MLTLKQTASKKTLLHWVPPQSGAGMCIKWQMLAVLIICCAWALIQVEGTYTKRCPMDGLTVLLVAGCHHDYTGTAAVAFIT
jgi:hypothetical protein